MNIESPSYKLIKNVVTKEYAQQMIDSVNNNNLTEDHPFSNFQGIPLDYSKVDPENKVADLINYAEKYFIENYVPQGRSIVLTRSYGTIMHKDARLEPHKDHYDSGREHDFTYGDSLVCNLYLSNCEGGELYFEELGVDLKVEIGDAVLFPGHLLTHGVRTVTAGSRIVFLNHFSLLSEEDSKNIDFINKIKIS